ncbi:cupin domain-containing protein [Crassaminicella profunda]|uniref:cupin domain-containing protein n=1 Tax=Crassaminicella profunda TaxID=1286698 RepID=UPI001CA6F5A4|nr:cupin domain-containing protein [Crassaminicella profunda]QZY53820.1 cupin domain-containing protein [Crassaminicella profunda]
MFEKNFIENFEKNKVSYLEKDEQIISLKWHPHPTFEGVYLKHLVQGVETNNQLSCHLVRVDPGCKIDTHIHEGKIEIHEVIQGNGVCLLDKKKIPYSPGSVAVIPADLTHKVVAGDSGIYILAKFTPALL